MSHDFRLIRLIQLTTEEQQLTLRNETRLQRTACHRSPFGERLAASVRSATTSHNSKGSMVFVGFNDKDYKDLSFGRDLDKIPKNTRSITIASNAEAFGEDDADYPLYELDCKALANMVMCSSIKLGCVLVLDFIEVSPEYLSLLTSILSNSHKVIIQDFAAEDVTFGCLFSGLLQRDGPKELWFSSADRLSTHQANLLLEGISISPCLEHFSQLRLHFEDQNRADQALLGALRQNHNLKNLLVHFNSIAADSTIHEIFQTAVVTTKVQCLTIHAPQNDIMETDSSRILPWSTVTDILGREHCTLETLQLKGIDIQAPVDSGSPPKSNQIDIRRNVCIKHLSLEYMNLDSICISQTIAPFQSLVSLKLKGNKFSDLSPLDPLVLGSDGLTLKEIDLGSNLLSEGNAINFFRKLPQVKHLRRLILVNNPFLDGDAWIDVLKDVMWQNTSLEQLVLCTDRKDKRSKRSKRMTNAISEIQVPLSLNRGWRQAMDYSTAPHPKILPPNLWPLVLQRATRIGYYENDFEGDWIRPDCKTWGNDVQFWFLRKVVCQIFTADHGPI